MKLGWLQLVLSQIFWSVSGYLCLMDTRNEGWSYIRSQMPPTPHSVPCISPMTSPVLLPVLKVAICLLHLPFLIKFLSGRISWRMFWGNVWGSYLSSPFLLPLPLFRPPYSCPDIITSLQLVSHLCCYQIYLPKGLFLSEHFLNQKYSVAPHYTQIRVQSSSSIIHSLTQPGSSDFSPNHISFSPSLTLIHNLSRFCLHAPQFIVSTPSLCLEYSFPNPISISLHLAHLYPLELVRNNRGQNIRFERDQSSCLLIWKFRDPGSFQLIALSAHCSITQMDWGGA